MSWKNSLSRTRRSPALVVALLASVLASAGSAAAVTAGGPAGARDHAGRHTAKHKKAPACIASLRPLCSSLRRAVDTEIGAYLGAHSSSLRGSAGPTGASGPGGATGAAGAANGYTDQHPGLGEQLTLTGGPSTVSTLNLPAGNYVVQADVHLTRLSGETPVTCRLQGATTLDESVEVLGTSAGLVAVADLALSGPLTLSAPGSVSVRCIPEVGNQAAARATVTAVQVTNLTSSTT